MTQSPAVTQPESPRPQALSRGHVQVGTSFYISPEVAHVAKESDTYDAKADVFSLGMIAFELWHPFGTGMERVRLMQRHAAGG